MCGALCKGGVGRGESGHYWFFVFPAHNNYTRARASRGGVFGCARMMERERDGESRESGRFAQGID